MILEKNSSDAIRIAEEKFFGRPKKVSREKIKLDGHSSSYYRQFTWYGYGYLIPVRYWYGTRTGTVRSGGHSYSYWYGNWYGMSIGSKSIVFIGRELVTSGTGVTLVGRDV